MLKSKPLFALLFISLMAVIYWRADLPAQESLSPQTPQFQVQESPAARKDAAPVPRAPVPSSEAVVSSELEAAREGSETQDSSPLYPYVPGLLQGRVLDGFGEVIPKGRVLFRFAGQRQRPGSSISANAAGEYRIELAPGPWNVFFTGLVTDMNSGCCFMGAVQVLSNQTSTFDLVLVGTREFAGGFFDGINDMTILELEMFFAHDPSFVVAEASCSTDLEAHADYLKALEEVNPDVPRRQTSRPDGLGSFLISGLIPEVYLMRLYLDVDKKHYVSAEVDLTQADLKFVPIEMKAYEDFLQHRVLTLRAEAAPPGSSAAD
ncbi:MAG: hypothetical protein ACI9F9_000006 [Candidatus Paceibacteria bacterium]|jgi:hypothetical protein